LASIIWTTYACTGDSVELTDDDLRHIRAEHPDLTIDEQAIRVTVEAPEVCTLEIDGSLNFYRRGVIPRREGRYLHVLVRRPGLQAQAAVHTAWASKAIDPFEEILC
jgi:hypothetical protein